MMEYYKTIRRDWLKADTKRDEGLKDSDKLIAIDNIQYGPYGDENLMDIYYPKQSINSEESVGSLSEGGTEPKKRYPVIINVHGGAYVYGTKEIYRYYMMSLAERGFLTVNINYRLAPENSFPATLEDVNEAIKYILAHEDEYPVDMQNIFMVGDSAGANMASLYACLLTSEEYRKIVNIMLPANISINAIALNCGLYDPEFEVPSDLHRPELNKYLLKEKDVEASKYIGTVNYVTKDFPPTFLMSGYYDFLKCQVEPMEKALTENGVEHITKVYGTKKDKELSHVFHVNMKLDMAHVCNKEECEFFKKFIK
ncbi:MAG: alpha/beta hydrolase [Lachnospiraceae bacterium]|nr:alpha/beta hydrolase [Lachnospiraceae bacterium]